MTTEPYSLIIQNALDINDINIDDIQEIKNDLDIIVNNSSKSWAPLKALMVSLIAKIKHQDWDTRYHQIQIGGKYSLRTIDKNYVSSYLYKIGLYDTPTEFALTRSFEKAEPFNKEYSGKISPKECKNAFLNLIEIINFEINNKLLNDMLVYLLIFLKNRKIKITGLCNSELKLEKKIEIVDIIKILEEINDIGTGSSVIPVIITHTLLSIIQPYLWKEISINKLKEHTANDNKSFGDIEGIALKDNKPKIIIEVKYKIHIDETIVMIFDKKTFGENIPLKFIITTANVSRKIVKNNICIDSLTSFISSYLQLGLFYETNLCMIFMEELRQKILNYKNLSLQIKETIQTIFIKHLE